MNTFKIQNMPRVLINSGNGCEVLDLMAQTDWNTSPVDFLWWSKSPQATQNIRERLPHANVLEGHTRYLTTLAPPYPLRKIFPNLYNETKIREISRLFPAEWLTYTLRWDTARAAQLGKPLDNIYVLFAALHLAEAVRVLAITQPDLLLLRGGNIMSDAAQAIVAKTYGIPVLYTERGAFPKSLFLAPALIGPEMALAVNIENENAGTSQEAASYSDQFIRQYMNHDHSAWMQPGRTSTQALRRRWNIPEDYRVVFYAAQRPADANMLLNSPHFSSNGDFIRYVIKALSGVEKTAVIVKPHPKELPEFDNEIHEAIQSARQNGLHAVCDREVNIKDAIGLSSVVVSINSTTGLEALLYGVPVVVGGEAYYSHQGYTFDVKSATDPTELERLRNFLKKPTYTPAQQQAFRAFICRLNAHYQFFMESAESQNGPTDYLQTIVKAATDMREKTGGQSVRPPATVLCPADALLQEYAILHTLPMHDPIILLKSYLRHKWTATRS